MSNILYDLWYEREYSDRSDTNIHIGVFNSKSEALEAVDMIKSKPGFLDFPEGFSVHEIVIGRIAWKDGFTTRYSPREKRLENEAFDLPA